MQNPVQNILEWFERLPEDVQKEVAFLMSFVCPLFDQTSYYKNDHDKGLVDFKQTMHNHIYDDHRSEGFALAFRATFDYLFVRTRGTAEQWEESRAFMQRANEQIKSERGYSSMDAVLENMPKRQELWIGLCADWEAFKESQLTDDYLDRWSKALSIREVREHQEFQLP